jgi:hypothetical protein
MLSNMFFLNTVSLGFFFVGVGDKTSHPYRTTDLTMKVNGKFALCLTDSAPHHEAVWGSGCIDPCFLDMATAVGEWSASHPSCFTLPTHWVGGCVDLRALPTGCRLGDGGVRVPVPVTRRIFLFSTSSRPGLGPTHPPIQLVWSALSPGVKRPGAWSGLLTSN